MKRKYLMIVFSIAIVTLVTRFVNLSKSPPHLSNDEVSLAYDAYSISKTLRDEHNNLIPISFESHGDYKAPLTVYLTSFSIKLLGNTDFSARFTSALIGSLTVLIFGLLTWQLTKNIKLSILASSILSITPWHIYTSRMLLETNIALFFLVCGLYLHFYAINKKKYLMHVLSFIFFALSMYSYHTEKVLVPLVLVSLLLLKRRSLHKNKSFKFGIIIFVFLITPLFVDYVSNINTNTRARTQLLFTQESFKSRLDKYPGPFRKGQVIIAGFYDSYSTYIEPKHLFFENPSLLPQPEPYQSGFFLAPFIFAFFYGLFKVKKHFGENTNFIYIWLIISPIVPALTVGGAHVVRNLPLVAPITLIIATGCYEFIIWSRNNRLLQALYFSLIIISFFYFYALYWHFFPKESGENFQYGYKQVAEFIKPRYDDYQKIIIDPKFGEGYYFDGVPHLYISYYTTLDPKYLQERIKNDPCGNCFSKYEIRGIDWTKEKIEKGALYVVPFSNKIPETLSGELEAIYEISLPNLRPAFIIYESSS